MKFVTSHILSILVSFLFCLQGFAQTITPADDGTIYVRKGYQGDGSSWNNAVGELADALKWADDNQSRWTAQNPLKIYVAKGVYKPMYSPEDGIDDSVNPADNRDKSFLMVKHVQLYGGFDPEGNIRTLSDQRIVPQVDDVESGTILSGDIGQANDNTDNVYHVLLSVMDVGVASIDGFTITGGFADGQSSISVNGMYVVAQHNGAGMLILSSSLTVSNCHFFANTTSMYGGGLYNSNSSLTVRDSYFTKNSARVFGGGISIDGLSAQISGSTFTDNTALQYGGGMYSFQSKLRIHNSNFMKNTSIDGGGAIASFSSSPIVTNTRFIANETEYDGGAIYNTSSFPIIGSSSFMENTADATGGALYNNESSAIIVNSNIAGNKAPEGAGLYNSYHSDLKIYNSILSGNRAINNKIDNITNQESAPMFKHSFLEGDTAKGWVASWGMDKGDNQISAFDPFVDADGGNYSLIAGSSAINAGDKELLWELLQMIDRFVNIGSAPNDDSELWGTDLGGNQRIVGSAIDIGAYEYSCATPAPMAPIKQTFCASEEKTVADLVVTGTSIRWYREAQGGDAYLDTHLLQSGIYYASQIQDGCESGERMAVEVEVSEVPLPVVDDIRYVYGDEAVALMATPELGNSLLWYITDTGGTGNASAPIPMTDAVSEQIFWVSQLTAEGCESGRAVITVKVEPAPLTVTVTKGQVKLYGGFDPFLTYTVEATELKNADEETIVIGELERIEGEEVGNYSVNKGTLQIVSGNYTLIFVSADFEIAPAELTVTVKDRQTKVYGEDDPVFGYMASGFKFDDDETVLEGVLSRNQGENVDSYSINQATLNIVNNNYTLIFESADFEIIPAELTVNALANTKVYGTDDPAFNYTVTGFKFQDLEHVLDGSLHRAVGEDVGLYAVEQGNLNVEANYYISFVGADFEITKADLSGIKFDDATFTYDGTVKSLSISDTLPRGASVSYTNNNQSNIGTYIVTANIDGGTNYEDLLLTADLTIEKAIIAGITFDDTTFTYDGDAKSLSISGTLPAGASVTYTSNEYTDAGAYTVTASIDGGNNYEDLTLTADLMIEKADVTGIIFNDATFIYDGTLKSLAIAGTLPSGTSVTYINNDQTNAGIYTITADIDGGNNYENLILTAELMIEKAGVNGITFDDARFIYDGSAKSLAIAGTLPTGTSVAYTNNDQTDAGMYTVTATLKKENYEAWEQTATLIIDKAESMITADAVQTYSYDGTIKNVMASLNHNETELSFSPAQGYADAGTYEITISSRGTTNYHAAGQKVQLVISPNALSGLKFSDRTVVYNGEAHHLHVEGLAEGSSVIYDNNGQVDVGTYTVTAKVSHPNYQEKTVRAILTIKKANQEISFGEVGTVSRDVNRVPLAVSSSSGLQVTVKSDDPLVATVDGGDLLIHRLGTVRLTASQEGDKNYEAAEPVFITVQVADEEEGPVKVHQAFSPNGDGINDFLILEGIKDYRENRLQVMSRTGLMVFDMEGYDNDGKVFRGISNTHVSSDTLPVGTYFYVLKYKDGGKWRTKKGWFVLKL